VSTCYYAWVAALTGRIAAVLGKTEEAAAHKQLAARVRGAINARFFDAPRHQYLDGRQGANFYPIAFGLVPPEEVRAVLDRAIAILMNDRRGHFDTGFIGTPLVLDVLAEHGRGDVAFTLMNETDFPSFGYAIAKGATTLWEAWDGRGSHCHPMFGAVCRWFFQGLAGILPDPERPGFEHIVLRPAPAGDLTWCEARYRSIRGDVMLRWERERGKLRVRARVPANATATLLLDGTRRALGSGDHEFTA
jgi:alpha-L-rhamnosidase